MRKKKLAVTFIIFLLCAGAIFAVRTFAPKETQNFDKRTLARAKGDAKAPLWIVEYFDYQCPSCKTAHDLLDQYMQKYPGRVYLQVKFYPLPAHSHGLETAKYAECAARQNKFWKFHDLLFANQAGWSILADAEALFKDYAKTAGLDMKKCEACVKDPETEKTVMEEKGKAVALGVQLTPTCFINGKTIVGSKPLEAELKNYSAENSAEKTK